MSSSYKGHWINGSAETGFTVQPHTDVKLDIHAQTFATSALAKHALNAVPLEQLKSAGYNPRKRSEQLKEGRGMYGFSR